MVGINITTQIIYTGMQAVMPSLHLTVISMNSGTCTDKSTVSLDQDISELGNRHGKHSQMLYDMCKFYRDWHVESLDVYGRSAHNQITHFTSTGIMEFFKNGD